MSLLDELDFTDHRQCDELEAGVEGAGRVDRVRVRRQHGRRVDKADVEWTRPTMPTDLELDARGRRLRAALAAVLVRDRARELDLVHQWLDTWAGLGLVVAGMTHQGWDVQLTAYAARDWRANFFPVGIAYSGVGGSAWEPTPWRAVQRVALAALVALMPPPATLLPA